MYLLQKIIILKIKEWFFIQNSQNFSQIQYLFISRGNSEKANQNSSLILEKKVSTLQYYSVGWNLGPIALVPFWLLFGTYVCHKNWSWPT